MDRVWTGYGVRTVYRRLTSLHSVSGHKVWRGCERARPEQGLQSILPPSPRIYLYTEAPSPQPPYLVLDIGLGPVVHQPASHTEVLVPHSQVCVKGFAGGRRAGRWCEWGLMLIRKGRWSAPLSSFPPPQPPATCKNIIISGHCPFCYSRRGVAPSLRLALTPSRRPGPLSSSYTTASWPPSAARCSGQAASRSGASHGAPWIRGGGGAAASRHHSRPHRTAHPG